MGCLRLLLSREERGAWVWLSPHGPAPWGTNSLFPCGACEHLTGSYPMVTPVSGVTCGSEQQKLCLAK